MEYLLLFLRKYPLEIIFIFIAIVVTTVIYILYSQNQPNTEQVLISEEQQLKEEVPQTYLVDVAGAVKNPDVYKVPATSILSDVIKTAGGFSKEADLDFIGRNINLARSISDKEKIYIPTKKDVQEGMIANTAVLGTNETTTSIPEENESQKISINAASEAELDILPGVGPTTAKKIIENRPYTAIEELLSKKVTSQSTFNKIKDMVKL